MDVKKSVGFLYDYTSGYPYFSFKRYQLLDERVSDVQAYDKEKRNFKCSQVLLKRPNTLFDDMTKKLLDHPQLKKCLKHLFAGVDFPF